MNKKENVGFLPYKVQLSADLLPQACRVIVVFMARLSLSVVIILVMVCE